MDSVTRWNRSFFRCSISVVNPYSLPFSSVQLSPFTYCMCVYCSGAMAVLPSQQYICIHCATPTDSLYEQYPSFIKMTQCVRSFISDNDNSIYGDVCTTCSLVGRPVDEF